MPAPCLHTPIVQRNHNRPHKIPVLHPHLAARLRQRVAPELAGVALDALVRRDQFDDAARVALFRELAVAFKKLVEFPAEAVEALSDEQYVRNTVEILYRGR